MQLTAERIGQRHQGLGRALGILSLLSATLPMLLSFCFQLARFFDDDPFHHLSEACLRLIAPGILAAFVLVVLSVSATSILRGSQRPARIAVGPDGLRVLDGGRRHIPRAEIQTAILVPGHRPRVELRLRGERFVHVNLQREDDGVRLLAALGFGPSLRRVAVTLGTPNRQLAAGCIGLPLSFLGCSLLVMTLASAGHGGSWVPAGLVLGTLLATLLLHRAARPTRVTVGSDGILAERPFTRRWIPHAHLTRVQRCDDRLRLFYTGGAAVPGARESAEQSASHGPQDGTEPRKPATRTLDLPMSADLVDALARRISEVQAMRAVPSDTPRGTEALERGDRDVTAWRDDLRRLLAPGTYRAAASLTPEDALFILDDASSPSARRIGAALALRIADHPDAREHIRVAADTTADDTLRVALEEAAEADLDLPTLARLTR
ncbi:Hypothetical protein CAP_4487 [Chondromyces apiculatus DSM 436]|uniref:Uncharacterized protein n=1 Tax=Chondromyces apiculatus DSM 436 TaxID=1192034 RepID=A0A017T5L0_9BACT|nr:Hypothetical protein CAP_4487 [Chondromyces apiculatus DSM 436]